MNSHSQGIHNVRRWPGSPLVALSIGVLLALVGCSAQTGSAPTARQTNVAASTPNTAVTAPSTCGATGGSPVSVTGTEPNPGGHPSPALVHRLPDNLALKPQVSSTIPTEGTFILGNSVEMAFSAAVADGATPGTICGVAVRITAFQPLTTSVPNVIPLCGGQNIPYNVPGGWGPSSDCVTSGFGPGGGPAGGGSVTFTTAAVGTVASAPFGAFDFSTRVSYPFTPTSAPVKVPYTVAQAYGNYALLLTIQVAEAGDYTFDIGIWQDSSAPHFFNQTVSTSILTGRALHEWGGGFCKSPDMQQQLPPPTDPPTKVICPGPVPSR